MRTLTYLISLAVLLFMPPVASAGGWGTVHRYVHRTGHCGGAQEVMASYYSSGRRTANGETFNPDGNTAASRTHQMGTQLKVRNPHNNRTVIVRINDRGPWGAAHAIGVKLDLARGAARRLGINATSYVCIS